MKTWPLPGRFGLLTAALTIAAITSIRAAAPAASLPPAPTGGTRILLVTGIDYPGHLWRQTAPALEKLLSEDPRLKVAVTENPAALADPALTNWDAVVLHFMNWEKPAPGPEARENLRKYVAGGKGLMLVHFACGAWQDWPEFQKIAGRVWDPKLRGHDPHGAFQVEIADPNHPITRGMQGFETTDELYTCLTGETSVHTIARARSKVDGLDYTMAFVLDYGKGRVFHTVLGHDVRAITNSAVPELMRRGCAWAAGLPPIK